MNEKLSNNFMQFQSGHCFHCHKDYKEQNHLELCSGGKPTPWGCEKCAFKKPSIEKKELVDKINCKKCGIEMEDQKTAKEWADIGSLIVCDKCATEDPGWIIDNM